MDSDDENYDDFNDFNGSNDFNDPQEMDVEVCGKKNSSFEALTTADITDLMNQYIDDVKSIVQVSFSVVFFFNSFGQFHENVEMICDDSEN